MIRKMFVIVLGLALLSGFNVAEADGKKGGRKLVLRVDTHEFATFDAGAPVSPGTGFPFFVSGDICKDKTLLAPCHPIGVFYCWGWDNGQGLAVVSQEFDLFGYGKIQVQGVEDEGPRAVVGGTGWFRNVSGQAVGFDFSEFLNGNGEFIGTFNLKGTKHKRDNDSDSDSDSD